MDAAAEAVVLEASDADLRASVANALARAGGVTFDELARQASTGDFADVRARLAWVAVGDLRDYAR